ncbi:MAG: hypothetical protein OXC19_12110 [Bryobacterales bacterium]|nr:hypothetical protein [Bryobacterales bacterium]
MQDALINRTTKLPVFDFDVRSLLDPSRSAAATIDSFRDLPDGWQFGEGRGATKAAHETARQIDTLLLNTAARVIEAFPYLDGGVLVCGRYANEDIEVSCEPDGRTLHLCHAIDDEPFREEDYCDLAFISDYIMRLPWEQRLFGYSTPDTIVRIKADTSGPRFRVPPEIAEPLASALSVPDAKAGASANTSWLVITQTYPANNRYFGALT